MESKHPNQNQSLLKGPGIIVTIIVIVPLMLFLRHRSWYATFAIALVGFGLGHLVNHFYFKSKNKDDNQ